MTKIGNVDPYLGMEIVRSKGDEEGLKFSRVKNRAVDENGKQIGKPSNNPIVDGRQYKVEYAYGNTAIMAASIIA